MRRAPVPRRHAMATLAGIMVAIMVACRKTLWPRINTLTLALEPDLDKLVRNLRRAVATTRWHVAQGEVSSGLCRQFIVDTPRANVIVHLAGKRVVNLSAIAKEAQRVRANEVARLTPPMMLLCDGDEAWMRSVTNAANQSLEHLVGTTLSTQNFKVGRETLNVAYTSGDSVGQTLSLYREDDDHIFAELALTWIPGRQRWLHASRVSEGGGAPSDPQLIEIPDTLTLKQPKIHVKAFFALPRPDQALDAAELAPIFKKFSIEI